jgi:hypothetical protein
MNFIGPLMEIGSPHEIKLLYPQSNSSQIHPETCVFDVKAFKEK